MAMLFESALAEATVVIGVLAAVACHYFTSTFVFWERLHVPFIRPEPFFGNVKDILLFRKSQFEAFQGFYRRFKMSGHRYGGIFQLRTPALLVCCPEIVKDILIKNFSNFYVRPLVYDEDFDPLSAHLVALEGPKWKFLRSKLSPAFTTGKLKGMLAVMKEVADRYVGILEESIERGDMIEMRKSCSLYLMDIIAEVAFGLRINALQEDSQFLHMGVKFFKPTQWERISQTISNSIPWLYKTFKLRMVSKEVTEFFKGVVKDAMDHRRRENIQKNDFLHFLMKIKEIKGTKLTELEEMKGVEDYNMCVDENSIELTDGVIAAQAFVFFLAGYETSSSTLSCCIHTLADHPEIQEKLFQEVNQAIEKFGDLTYEAIQSLFYVEQVLEETLRMYPPIGLLIRKSTKPYQIPGTDTIIPEGTQVFIPTYSFHYDPEYFPSPKEFKPERFSPGNREKLVPYSFMPFGHGPRVCIGERLAMLKMKMSLAVLVRKFSILRCEKTAPFRISPHSFFLAPTDGLWVRLAKRENPDPKRCFHP